MTHYWLRLLTGTETGVLPADQLAPITQECAELVAILTTIVKKSQQAPD